MKKSNRIIIILSLLVLMTITVGTITLARYSATNYGEGHAKIAVFEPGITTLETTISSTGVPGDSITKTIDVTNYSDNNVTDVKLEYTVNIIRTNNLPVSINLTSSDTNVTCANNVCTGVFAAGTKQTQTLNLNINWGTTSNDRDNKYNNQVDAVYLEFEAVQMDN